MNMVEKIQKVLEIHRIGTNRAEYVQKCAGCPWMGWNHDQHVAEVIQDAVQPIITTVEQLDAIPRPDVDTLGGPLVKSTCLVDPANGNYGLGTVYEGNDDGTWTDLDAGTDQSIPSSQVPLPTILIWEP